MAAGTQVDKLYVDIGADLSEFNRKMQEMSTELRDVGESLTMYVSAPLALLAGASLKTAADFEKLEKGLEAAMGSAAAAKKEFVRLKKAAQNPGLGFKQALRGSVQLQAVGLSAGQARNALSEFGNALALAGGSAESLNDVSRALTQIISKGKVSAEEINQLAEHVPQVRKAMKEAFGTANTERIQDMNLAAEDFVNTLVRQLGALERAEGGLANAFTNARIAITNALHVIGDELNKAFDVQGLVKSFSAKLGELVEWFQGLSKPAKQFAIALGGLAIVLPPVIMAIGTMATVLAGITATTAAVVAGVGAVAAAAALIYANWDGISSFMKETWDAVVQMTSASVQLLLEYVKGMWPKAKRFFLEGIAGLMGPLKGFAEFIGAEGFADSVASFQDHMKNLVPEEAIRENARRIAELKKQFTQGFGRTLVQGFTLFSGQAFGAAPDEVGEGLGNGGGAGSSGGGGGLQKMAADLKEVTAAGLETIEMEEELSQEIKQVGSVGREVMPQLALTTRAAVASIQDAVRGLSRSVGRFFADTTVALSKVIAGFSDWKSAWKTIGQAAKSFGQSILRVISRVIERIVAAVAETLIWTALLKAVSGGGWGVVGSAINAAAPDLSMQRAQPAGAGPQQQVNVNISGRLHAKGGDLVAAFNHQQHARTRKGK